MTAQTVAPEHEFEAAHGLPELLPPGERLLWQGAPDPWRLTLDALHVRGLALYFAALLAWRAGTALAHGEAAAEAALALARLLPLAALGVGLFALIGQLAARTTVYTLTDRRVVMRIGIVLTVTFNLPFATIESAALRRRADGGGDLALTLAGTDRIAYLHLWPHARPWQLKRPQPMLRALPDAQRVAALLAAALADTQAGSAAAPAMRPVPVRLPQALAA